MTQLHNVSKTQAALIYVKKSGKLIQYPANQVRTLSTAKKAY